MNAETDLADEMDRRRARRIAADSANAGVPFGKTADSELTEVLGAKDAMPTGRQETYKGYKLAELENGWWRVINSGSSQNQEPSLAELKAYIDQMEEARKRF